MVEMNIVPILNDTANKRKNESSSCNACGKGGCCGGFGIKAGSQRNVVYRNIFLYMSMGLIIFTVTYLIMQLLTWLM